MIVCASNASLLEPAILSALIAGAISVFGFTITARSARQDRQRKLFGEAFANVMSYREYPYIVRRRQVTTDENAISDELSVIQSNLNRHQALLMIESNDVGLAYQKLVAATRRVAGPLISQAWNEKPRSGGTDMNVSDVDLDELKIFDDAFISEVRKHFRLYPTRWLSLVRR